MRSQEVYTKQIRIAELAERHPQLAFTSLNHHIDMDWLREAHRRTPKDRAAGVDGQSAKEYGEDLESNLQSLIDRAKSGSYRAPPLKRGYIPKNDQEDRPIGMPTYEDKLLQRAVVMVLEPIYEHDFLDCSYAFRPNRSPHDALESLWKQIMGMGGCWLIDADIRKFFDTIVKKHLRSFLRRRVRDGVIERLVGKWLKAGVLEDGQIFYPEDGTPQGGVISPLLSNIYLHEVLDEWFETEIKPRLKGRAFLIRFADDFVMGFEVERDARRVLEVLAKRFARFGLEIHPEKTRLVDFRRPREHASVQATFDFLGFTHYWGKSRKGRMVVQRKTAGSRLSRAFKKVEEWCKAERHQPVADQWKTLRMKLQGHYGYYGITGNFRCLRQFLRGVIRRWHFWLNRRSRRREMPWRRFAPFLARYPLPPPRIVHSSYTPRVVNP